MAHRRPRTKRTQRVVVDNRRCSIDGCDYGATVGQWARDMEILESVLLKPLKDKTMRDKTNPNGFYTVADKKFDIKVGQKDHEALDRAIEYATETWNDVYQGDFANLVWVNPMNPNG